MHTVLKVLMSVTIILICTSLGRRLPTLSGLIATMPLTGALVLVWLFIDVKGNKAVMEGYAKGALWGILPSILFFAVAYFCFRKQMPLGLVLGASFGVWLCGAVIHQLLLR
ncbi:MAG: DUF3147 family protein [Candidatus Omnitrophica bacterium]|nr:DUF3147 family protein [Candidatus Omnitrophota bacterium]